jgi:maleate isomerase
MWQPDGWGSRARIGLLTPHNDIVPEGEFQAMAPGGVSIHAARVPLGWRSGSEPPPIGLDAARAFAEPPHVDDAAELLAAAPLSVIAYAFTSSSYLVSPDGDAALKGRLEERTHGIPVVIPCPSVVLALRALRVRRLALIHPPWFPAELDQLGAAYFRSAGVEVVYATAAAGLPREQLSVQPAHVHEWIRTHVPDTAEVVFIGGGGLRAIGAIRTLEEALTRPVLTANRVVFWHALRLARVDEPIVRYGQIFGCDLPDGTRLRHSAAGLRPRLIPSLGRFG